MSSLAHSINSNDRLGVMLAFAALAHAIVILGIVFDLHKSKSEVSNKSLDIIVVRNNLSVEKPDKADFLAQSSQLGGGTIEEKKKLTAPPVTPSVKPAPVKKTETKPTPASKPAPDKKVLVQQKSNQVQKTAPKPVETEQKSKSVSVKQLLASTQSEIDLLTAQIDRVQQNQTRKPKRKYINSSTQEYKYAAYLTAWRSKVERIGNLNYPEEAKKKKIYGNILMTVVLLPDGSVKSINIAKSSGHKLLDDAAINIVKLASPYAKFPDNIRNETDELVITRTWQFVNGNKLFSN